MNDELTGQENPRSLEERIEEIVAFEKKIVEEIRGKLDGPRNINDEFDESLTFGQRLADRVAAFGGSWTFISIFALVVTTWIVINSILLAKSEVFDPYPYILLNLVLSIIAAIQGPIIMMSQNRQAARDRLKAENDYHYEVQAQLDLANLRKQIDELRWTQLIEIQQKQMQALAELLEKGDGISDKN